MNSKIYRCGWCGSITDKNGLTENITKETFKRTAKILDKYGDRKTHKVYGSCCPNEGWD